MYFNISENVILLHENPGDLIQKNDLQVKEIHLVESQTFLTPTIFDKNFP